MKKRNRLVIFSLVLACLMFAGTIGIISTANTVYADTEINPTNLVWDDYYDGRAKWTAPADYTGTYLVDLYGSDVTSNANLINTLIFSVETSETEYDFFSKHYIVAGMNYVFTVRAKQSDDNYAYGARSATYTPSGSMSTFTASWNPSTDSDRLEWYKPWTPYGTIQGYYLFIKKDGVQVDSTGYIANSSSNIYSIYPQISANGSGTYSVEIYATNVENVPNYCSKATSADIVVGEYIHDISLDGDILSWTPYVGATTYTYNIAMGGGTLELDELAYDSESNKYSINLKDKCATFNVETGLQKWYIQAYDNNTALTMRSTGVYSYVDTKTPLDTPTNLQWNKTTISWDPVENANCYYYWINSGIATLTLDTSVVVKNLMPDEPYSFHVYAAPESTDLLHTKSATATSGNQVFSPTVTLTNSNVILSDLVNNSSTVIAENCVLNITDTITGAYLYEVDIGNCGGQRYELPINLLNVCKGNSITSGTYNSYIIVRDKDYVPLTKRYKFGGWTLDTSKYTDYLTGKVTITGTEKVGETLTATVTNSNNTGTLYYKWTRYNASTNLIDSVIEGASHLTTNTYTLTDADVGYKISCFVESSVEDGSIDSALTKAIEGIEISSIGGVATTKGELTQGSFPIGHVGQTYSPVVLEATGGSGNYIYYVTIGKIPNGMTLSSTGVLSGIPEETQTGYVTITVEDTETHKTAYANINLIVADDNWAPSITLASANNAVVSKEYSLEITCDHGVNDSITWTKISGDLPAGLSLAKSGTWNGYIYGAPTATGTYTFTLKAENSYGYDTKEYTIVVENLMTLSYPYSTYYLGDTVQITSSIGNSNVIWTVHNNDSSATIIDNNGLLTIGADETNTHLYVAATSKTNSYNYKTIDIDYENSTAYTITVIDGVAKNNLSVVITKIGEGKIVYIDADGIEGKKFNSWTVEGISEPVTFANSTNKSTSFEMPGGAVIVKANFDTILTSVIATIDTPINGNTPNKTIQTGSANYTATLTGLWHGAGYSSLDSTVFVTGQEYIFYVAFTANTGYTLVSNDELQVTINGKLIDYGTEYNSTRGWMRTLTASEVPNYSIAIQSGLVTKINDSKEVSSNAEENDVITIEAYGVDGKVFDKWVSSDVTFADANSATTTFTMPAKAVTIQATYTNIKYTASFDSNGGSGEIITVSKEHNEKYTLPACTFTAPIGKEFKCWSINSVEYEAGTEITITENITIKAIWKNLIYTISFDANGGSGEIASVQKEYNENYTLPDCTFTAPQNKEFKCWSINDKEYSAKASIMVLDNTTVKVVWKYIVYVVSFDADTGAGTMTDVEVNSGDKYTLPACTFIAPIGKEFKCWSIDDSEKAVGTEIIISENTTIKAVWKFLDKYTITFDVNGGTGSMSVESVNGEYTLPENTITAPDGKEFKCWLVNGTEYKVGETINVTANTVIKAVWEDTIKDQDPTPDPEPQPEEKKDDTTISEDKDDGLSGGAVAGIVIGILAFVLIGAYFIIGLILYKNGKLAGNIFKKIYKWIK